MNHALRLLVLLPLLLAACADFSLQARPYQLLPPATRQGRACAVQCPADETRCLRHCEAIRNSCVHNARLTARRSFLSYVNDRMAQGMLVDKKESDFYTEARNCPELDHCQQRCEVSKRACHTGCGGRILHQGNCIANCEAPVPDPEELDDTLFGF
jgi:hypothetical protein